MSVESVDVTLVAPDTIRAILTLNDFDGNPITSGVTHDIDLNKPDGTLYKNETSPTDNLDGTYTQYFILTDGSDSGVYELLWTATKSSRPTTVKGKVKVE